MLEGSILEIILTLYKGLSREKIRFWSWLAGFVASFEQTKKGLFTDFQGDISHFLRSPFSAKKSLESIPFLVLPQHEQFHPEALSVFAPFSLEFYLNNKVRIKIQGLSTADCNFQDLEFLF